MLALKHKDLTVWKRAIRLVQLVYAATAGFPASEQFGLTSQMRRAAVSVPVNIAERRRFFEIARSSAVEIDTQFEVAKGLGYPIEEEAELQKALNEVFALLSSMMK